MTDRRSSVPDYTCQGHVFECWVVNNGQSYVWRSGRIEVGRTDRSHWVRVDGRPLGSNYPDYKSAMRRGVAAVEREMAA